MRLKGFIVQAQEVRERWIYSSSMKKKEKAKRIKHSEKTLFLKYWHSHLSCVYTSKVQSQQCKWKRQTPVMFCTCLYFSYITKMNKTIAYIAVTPKGAIVNLLHWYLHCCHKLCLHLPKYNHKNVSESDRFLSCFVLDFTSLTLQKWIEQSHILPLHPRSQGKSAPLISTLLSQPVLTNLPKYNHKNVSESDRLLSCFVLAFTSLTLRKWIKQSHILPLHPRSQGNTAQLISALLWLVLWPDDTIANFTLGLICIGIGLGQKCQ